MRIITGRARGRRLKMPKGEVRPSTDRLREALFSILGNQVEDAQVLDLFAGTGSLGLESLSRGAESADFVERDRRTARTLSENIALCQLGGEVILGDAVDYVRRTSKRYDLILADPPYYKRAGDIDFARQLLAKGAVGNCLTKDGLFVLEVEKNAPLPEADELVLSDDRCYGISRLLFYVRPSQDA